MSGTNMETPSSVVGVHGKRMGYMITDAQWILVLNNHKFRFTVELSIKSHRHSLLDSMNVHIQEVYFDRCIL